MGYDVLEVLARLFVCGIFSTGREGPSAKKYKGGRWVIFVFLTVLYH